MLKSTLRQVTLPSSMSFDIASVTMDADGVEALALRVFGGVDQVNVGDPIEVVA